jgi:flagellar motility protein MotE (MotC chaperone)
MSKLLTRFAIGFSLPAALALWDLAEPSRLFAALAETHPLLEGCADVPEAVVLADELSRRSQGIERYLAALEEKRAEIASAEMTLRKSLSELKLRKTGPDRDRGGATAAIRDDVDRMVALYDNMKPAEAAAVIENLPVEFAAELLMRVQPENGARIIASVEPRQAAMLTAQMSVRSTRP